MSNILLAREQALSDVKESLMMLREKFQYDTSRLRENALRLYKLFQEQDTKFLLLGVFTCLVAVLVAWFLRRWRNRDHPEAEQPTTTAHPRNSVDTNYFRSARQSATTDTKFFQLSSKLCHKHNISVPPGMILKSSQVWEVHMGPVKKRGVAGVLMSPNNIWNKHKQKKTRIALEIVGPANKTVDLSSSSKRFVVSLANLDDNKEQVDEVAEAISESGEYLADDEYVQVRTYRPRKRGARKPQGGNFLDLLGKPKDSMIMVSDASMRTIGSMSTDNNMLLLSQEEESDDEMEEIYEDPEVLWSSDMKDWKSHREYPGNDCRALKQRGKLVEIQLGTGLTSSIRDLIFQSTEDRESFSDMVARLWILDENRARRQLKRYREMKQEIAEENDPSSDGQSSGDEAPADETIRLLIEIVSARDLPSRFSMDPYVLVKLGDDRVIHRTSVLVQTKNPIWTIKTGSLLLLCASPEDLIKAGRLIFSVRDFNSLAQDEVIGAVYFSMKQLLSCKGDRIGYDINLAGESDPLALNARLFLRIREATTSDVEFMKDLEKHFGQDGVYSSETLLPMRPPQSTLLKFQQKTGDEHEHLHRVRPFPDPEREDETTWLSSDDLYKESMMTSTNWVEVGSGDLGQLHVEILGCRNLPNMDRAIIGRKTDAFASIVFEDAAVTTDVVGQCLSPRWMPWSRRAFVFNVESPSSNLFIGLFDHDPEPPAGLEFLSAMSHDPIGRVEVQLSGLSPDTIYTLAFPLYFGDAVEEHERKERGKIWIRVRKSWRDLPKAMLAGTKPAPVKILSMVRPVDYRVVKYTTVGPRDDTGFNIWKFTEYIEELQGYEYFLGYIKDFAFNTWLWRGHYHTKFFGKKLRLPLHSMTAFFWGVVVTRDPNKLPSFLLFSIGWLLLACNEAVNSTPSPWHKCPAYYPNIWSLILRTKPDQEAIAPYQQLSSISKFDKARAEREKWRQRERELLNEQQRQMEEEQLGFGAPDQYNSVLDITTGSKSDSLLMRFLFPLKPVLYPIQQQMRQAVIYCRMSTSILLWEDSNYTFWITTASFVGSFLIYKIPFAVLFSWSLRISAWVFLGPWMLLADRYFFKELQREAMTDEERDEKLKDALREQYEDLLDRASSYQIRKENIVKMESMKRYMFGPHHVRVPRFRETRFKDRPLPESYAEPYNIEDAEPTVITERKYGQRLSGDMIPDREVEAYSAREDLEPRQRRTMMSLLGTPSRLLFKTRDAIVKLKETHDPDAPRPLPLTLPAENSTELTVRAPAPTKKERRMGRPSLSPANPKEQAKAAAPALKKGTESVRNSNRASF